VSALIVVQARMTSTRLPGKVLKHILGRPMLSFQIERLRQVQDVDTIVVATTTNRTDDPIVDFCAAEKVACTRGSEADVLSRYYEAAVRFQAQTIVRVTSDCPLLDPEVVNQVLSVFAATPASYDYVSNMIQPTFPLGMATEVMSFTTLSDVFERARAAAEREHVTPYIYWHPERYRIGSVTMSPNLSHHRWTVDTTEDFDLVSRIVQALYPAKRDFRMADVLSVLQAHPDWEDINRHVSQNKLIQSSRCNDGV
jgi:spore coat polysaccharide biosynthesis protein SpsF